MQTVNKIYGVSSEAESLCISQQLQAHDEGCWVYIAQDDTHMDRMRAGLTFFDPELDVLSFPAWDCLPYDRISPHARIVAKRMDALYKLIHSKAKKRVVLTTVNAILQRLTPKAIINQYIFNLEQGENYSVDELQAKLTHMGFQHVDMVHEQGDIACRGGIIDIFPAGYKNPVRLDFFGDELESIRYFDAVSQRSIETINELKILPSSEVLILPQYQKTFAQNYRQQFGSVIDDDPLYESIQNGRKYPGYEHWLPLFYGELETLFDYLDPSTKFIYNIKLVEMVEARQTLIQDYYEARQSFAERKQKSSESVYNPIAPETFYLLADEWNKTIEPFSQITLSPFVEGSEGQQFQSRPLMDLKADGEPDKNPFELLKDKCRLWQEQDKIIIVAAYSEGSKTRLTELLKDHQFIEVNPISHWKDILKCRYKNPIHIGILPFENGFISQKVILISEKNILGERLIRKTKKSRKAEEIIANAAQLEEKDYLVHQEHGVGQYHGLKTLKVGSVEHDFLELQYHGDAKLFVPVENIDLLSRYGAEHGMVKLDKMGTSNWQDRKSRVKKKIRDLADQLMKIAAQRLLKKQDPVEIDPHSYSEFCSRFPYPETDDQLNAIEDIFTDYASGKNMDRLVCGDVGFGKTEVALRAAFAVAMTGKQVAVLVPTTLLCYQHFRNFQARFEGFPIKIAQLSRFQKPSENKKVKQEVEEGKIDIVIGTHAILAKSVNFSDLGLTIVDEEQHFGVSQKEKLKSLKSDVHVLTLTATPIPRTLQMSLAGVRDLSLIATPPIDRLAVRTYVLPYDPVVIKEAIMREYFRGGQCFYVCPRLKDIPFVHEQLKEIVPDIKIAVAHGQLSNTQLEDTLNAFYEKKFDLLLSTNIVESGLDLPDANTIIIHRSDRFGLSQLYQLRGRVGRSKIRAYAYLTIPPNRQITADAEKRLEVMQTLDNLGAGFTLASHDLDIRGAGNLLGEEQSGHIREVGTELYQKMLEDAVREQQSQADDIEVQADWTPQISLGLSVLIPEAYIQDLNLRLSLYRQIANLQIESEIDEFAASLIDRFGQYPSEVDHLLKTVNLKIFCKKAYINKLDAGPKGFVMQFYKNEFPAPEKLLAYISNSRYKVQLRKDQSLFVPCLDASDQDKYYRFIKERLIEVGDLV